MSFPKRPIAYVLASSNHGPMIINRNDRNRNRDGLVYGVGHEILCTAGHDETEVRLALAMLDRRRHHFGDGVFALDGGANIGVHTVEWARHMHGWGRVLAFEAQEIVYYALAGNIALNNCFNASARLAALGAAPGEIQVPSLDHFEPASFGSLEIKPGGMGELIGQSVSYDAAHCVPQPVVSIDSLKLTRLDFIKLDVEGMELEVLDGARETLGRCRPIMVIEIIKSDRRKLNEFLTTLAYRLFRMGPNTLAVHESDPTVKQISEGEGMLKLHL